MFQMKILKSKEGKILSLIFIAFDLSCLDSAFTRSNARGFDARKKFYDFYNGVCV